jgi:hypothetical protein
MFVHGSPLFRGVDPLVLHLLSHILPHKRKGDGGPGGGEVEGAVGRGEVGGLPSWLPRCVVVPCVHLARRLNPF